MPAADDGVVIGYACISFAEEEAYNALRGAWLSLQPYAVIHRMVINNDYKGMGLSDTIMDYAERLCGEKGVCSIKIDTDRDNLAMQHILTKRGYEYCGVIRFDYSDKIAYEKLL